LPAALAAMGTVAQPLHVQKRQGVKGCKRSRQVAAPLTTLANTWFISLGD